MSLQVMEGNELLLWEILVVTPDVISGVQLEILV